MHSTKHVAHNQDKTTYDALIFSPHLDDAVLSMGTRIAELVAAKKTVCVVTMFTKGSDMLRTKDVMVFLQHSGASSGVRLFEDRMVEDNFALQKLGVQKIIHNHLVDGLFRSYTNQFTGATQAVYPSFQQLFSGRVSPHDNILVEHIQQLVLHLIKAFAKPTTTIYGPMGVGRHVDHILIHQALASISSLTRIFWEDIPYRASPTALFARLATTRTYQQLPPAPNREIKKYAALKAKSLQCYKSQFAGLEKGGLGTFDLYHEVFYRAT